MALDRHAASPAMQPGTWTIARPYLVGKITASQKRACFLSAPDGRLLFWPRYTTVCSIYRTRSARLRRVPTHAGVAQCCKDRQGACGPSVSPNSGFE